MQEHPIQGLMKTAMENIRDMVDVNTIVGDSVESPDGTVIIPISKVSFGFASGGGEYGNGAFENLKKYKEIYEAAEGANMKFPFAGGSGAGITISPVAFMICGKSGIKLLPVNINSPLEKVIDLVPELFDKVSKQVDRMTEEKSTAGKKTNIENITS